MKAVLTNSAMSGRTVTKTSIIPNRRYDACSNAWGGYVNSSLRNLITKGKGQPNRKEQVATKKKTVKAKPIGKKNRKK